MANYTVISQKPTHSSFVLEEIEKEADSRELSYREEKTLEYLKEFSKLSKKEVQNALQELQALEIPRLELVHLIKILEIMPANGQELRAIVSHGGVVVVDDVVAQILEILKKYQ